MRKRLLAALAALALLLSSCSSPAEEEPSVRVLCTTYPVYLLTTALTAGEADLRVELLVNAQTSCLHDYTLTVKDMKAIEGAQVIVQNGGGLEDFMSTALASSTATVIDCSAGMELLPMWEHDEKGQEGHHHGEEYDPHIWMAPERAIEMLEAIALGLEEALPGREFQTPCRLAAEELRLAARRWEETLSRHRLSPLITFHDGFQYFARAFDLELLRAIEEEEGSTASAAEIREIAALIGERDIPAIFTERNGAQATAQAIRRETGCQVFQLDLLMSGRGSGVQGYIDAMDANIQTIVEALG